MKIGGWPRHERRLATRGSSMRTKTVISAFIVVIAGVHAAPILQEMRGPGQTFWPIMAWGMYRTSHGPPVQASGWEIFAETVAGERWEVRPVHAGQGPNGFSRVFVNPMADGDSAAARRLGEILNLDAGDRVVRLVVEGATYRVTDRGVVVVPEASVTYTVEN